MTMVAQKGVTSSSMIMKRVCLDWTINNVTNSFSSFSNKIFWLPKTCFGLNTGVPI